MVFRGFNPFYNTRQHGWQHHVCGLYYLLPQQGSLQKTYLPPVDLQVHTTILDTTSRTALTQTFINPSSEKGIREVRYTFPLYDGVSVVGFTCHVGDRTITGEVKEKEKARAVFKEAVARGETAGLLEQLPDAADVFTTTVGNIPPGAKVVIQITYLGELKHDMETDGIRFTIPNIICPRYGEYPGTLQRTSAVDAIGGSISIIVDAEMADGSFIRKMQSPSHPISMNMGTISSAPDAEPVMTKASATLSLGSVQLETDFILQVIAKNTGVPKAVLENHPSIPNHRALMTTLVPRFSLPAEKPEIVFVCDRSGSMAGSRIALVVQALKVFLKSLPVGVKFNICSFGNSHSFLWPKSVTYDQSTLDQAIRHVGTFLADYGGTEMLQPLKATIERRYKDIPLDIMVLTDGQIWNEQVLFDYLNQSVKESESAIRLFTLGIGNGVSHALIEGIAKAGDGFSQSVAEGEKMDTKVVRMLKGALSPHINNYTLEVKYSGKASIAEDDDDFEVIEKVTDSLKVHLDLGDEKKEDKTPISLFDTSVDPDREEPQITDETGEGRYAHLPKMAAPKIVQAPQNIPSLFAFNRTTAYLLLGPEAPQEMPKSVVLRGTSAHGPLELEIPVQILASPGQTIHQLAAKKAISELEQGRGWLPEAKDDSDTLIKSKFEGRFADMVEREAVRLGVQFQVGGKWCSFVAVESSKKTEEKKEKETEEWEWLEGESPNPDQGTGTILHDFLSQRSRHSRQGSNFMDQECEVTEEEEDDDDEAEESEEQDDHFIDMEGRADDDEEEERGKRGKRGGGKREGGKRGGDNGGEGSSPLATGVTEEIDTQNACIDRSTCETDEEDDIVINRKRPRRFEYTDTNERPDNVQTKKRTLIRKSVKGLMMSSPATADQAAPTQSSMSQQAMMHAQQQQQQQQQHQGASSFGASRSSGYASSSLSATQASRASFAPQNSMAPSGATAFGADQTKALEEYQTSLMMLRQEKKSQIGGPSSPAFGAPAASSGASNVAQPTTQSSGYLGQSWANPFAHPYMQSGTPVAYGILFGSTASPPPPAGGNLFAAPARTGTLFGGSNSQSQAPVASGGLFGSSASTPAPAGGNLFAASAQTGGLFGQSNSQNASGGLFKSASSVPVPAPPGSSHFGSATGGAPFGSAVLPQASGYFGQANSLQGAPSVSGNPFRSAAPASAEEESEEDLFGPDAEDDGTPDQALRLAPAVVPRSGKYQTVSHSAGSLFGSAPSAPSAEKTPEDLVHQLIGLQTFEGSWEDTSSLLALLEITKDALAAEVSKATVDKKVYVTALVIAVLEHKLQDFQGSWELVVDKARGWVADQGVGDVDGLVLEAKVLVK